MKALIFLEKSFDVIATSIKETTAIGVGFATLVSAVIAFVVRSWQVNLLLFIVLLVLIAINTWSGVRNAKKNKTYNFKILKETLISKCIGYFILIIAVSLLVIMFFIASLRDGDLLFPEYFLNVIVMTTFVGLGVFEFRSIIENLRKGNNHVPQFIDDIVDRAEDKLNTFSKKG